MDIWIVDKKKKEKIIKKKDFVWWLITFFITLFLYLALNAFVFINAEVPTTSMFPAISPGNKTFTNRLAYKFKAPQRKDIVAFLCPDNDMLYVKRIIGLPGEKIEIKNGDVYIDNKILEEKEILKDYDNFGPYFIPDNTYFLLGDNRFFSEDSRYWDNKFVPQQNILGKVVFKYNFIPLEFKKLNN